MEELFFEFVKSINCNAKVEDNNFVITDSLYEPILNIGGYKFSFDDVEGNELLGLNGKKYTVPFEYRTNDGFRGIKCDSFNENLSYIITKKTQNERTTFKVEKKDRKNNLDIIFGDILCSFYFKKKSDNYYIIDLILYKEKTKYIHSYIKISYIIDATKKILDMSLYNVGHKNNNNSDVISTCVTMDYINPNLIEKNSHYRNFSGNFTAKHIDEDKIDVFHNISLNSQSSNDYFEDLSSIAKSFYNIFITKLNETNPNLYTLLLNNYPEFNELMKLLDSSKNKGILQERLNDYFSIKSDTYKKEIKLILNDNIKNQ